MSNHLNPSCAQWDVWLCVAHTFAASTLNLTVCNDLWFVRLFFQEGGKFFSFFSLKDENKLSLMDIRVLGLCILSFLLLSTCPREEAAFRLQSNKEQFHSNQAVSQEGEAMLQQSNRSHFKGIQAVACNLGRVN